MSKRCGNQFCPNGDKLHIMLFPDGHGNPGRVCQDCFVKPELMAKTVPVKRQYKGLKVMTCDNVRCTLGEDGGRKVFKQNHPKQISCCKKCNGMKSNQKHADKVRVKK